MSIQPAMSRGAPRVVNPVSPAVDAATLVQLSCNAATFALPALPPSGPGQPMPDDVQSKMEAALGADFSDVRVHVGPQAPSIGALAYTQGSNIFFAPGQYSPATYHGQQLLGHELTHVLQQRAGRVRNPFGSGVAVVQDLVMEAEAENMGRRAATYRPPLPAAKVGAIPAPASKSVQLGAMQAKVPAGVTPGTALLHVSDPAPTDNGSYRIVAGSAGYQVGSVMVHTRDQSSIEVTDLGVDRSHRQQGLGAVLMASAMRTGLRLGRSKVTLASQDNGSGRLTQWYKSMGFSEVGVNKLGYPRLEAPISQVLSGVAQARMAPLPAMPRPVHSRKRNQAPESIMSQPGPQRNTGHAIQRMRKGAKGAKLTSTASVLRSYTDMSPFEIMTAEIIRLDIPCQQPPADVARALDRIWRKVKYYPTWAKSIDCERIKNKAQRKGTSTFKWNEVYVGGDLRLPVLHLRGKEYAEYYLRPTHHSDLFDKHERPRPGSWGSRRLLVHLVTGHAFYSPNHYGANAKTISGPAFIYVGRITDTAVLPARIPEPAPLPPQLAIDAQTVARLEKELQVASQIPLPDDGDDF